MYHHQSLKSKHHENFKKRFNYRTTSRNEIAQLEFKTTLQINKVKTHEFINQTINHYDEHNVFLDIVLSFIKDDS